eukprot:COSAG06_NODE_3520_length_5232_cov_6.600429_2_plen_100_part_00
MIWALNVYSLSTKQTCDQIAYIADLPGQQAPGVLLELGAKPSCSLSCLLRASRACLVNCSLTGTGCTMRFLLFRQTRPIFIGNLGGLFRVHFYGLTGNA